MTREKHFMIHKDKQLLFQKVIAMNGYDVAVVATYTIITN